MMAASVKCIDYVRIMNTYVRTHIFFNDYVRTHNFAHNFLSDGLIDLIRSQMWRLIRLESNNWVTLLIQDWLYYRRPTSKTGHLGPGIFALL